MRYFSAGDKHLIRHKALRVVVVLETPEFGYCTVEILLFLIATGVFVNLKLRAKTLKTYDKERADGVKGISLS